MPPLAAWPWMIGSTLLSMVSVSALLRGYALGLRGVMLPGIPDSLVDDAILVHHAALRDDLVGVHHDADEAGVEIEAQAQHRQAGLRSDIMRDGVGGMRRHAAEGHRRWNAG